MLYLSSLLCSSKLHNVPQFLLSKRQKKLRSYFLLWPSHWPRSMGPEQICSPAVDVSHAGFLVKPVHTQRQSLSSCCCSCACTEWPGSGLGSSPHPGGVVPYPPVAGTGRWWHGAWPRGLPRVGKPRLQESHWLDLRWMCPSCVKTKKCTTSIYIMLTHKMKNSCSLWSQLSSLNHMSSAEFLPVALGFLHNYYFSNTGLQLLWTREMGSETDTYEGKVYIENKIHRYLPILLKWFIHDFNLKAKFSSEHLYRHL